ncbi:MAG: restriction endonuclease subunit M [Spirochaetales bacterium]|nr:restriction endonuclease subunit M [Spirochaetales bacterium]
MSKMDPIRSRILAAHSLEGVAELFTYLQFPVRREDECLHVELDDNSFLEVFVFAERSEVARRASTFLYQRAGVLALSADFEEWIFIRRGMEDRIRLQRYKVQRQALRENPNAVPLQRLSALKFGQISGFEDLFDRKDISQRFYREFIKQKAALGHAIQGISDPEEKRLYAQVLLDRLIFLFFLQSRGLLNGEERYFATRFVEHSKKRYGFYQIFLKELFFAALCQSERRPETLAIVGQSIPYLNGGLFLQHELEEKYPGIKVENESFGELFRFFESWRWNVSERSDSDEDAIDPYILGYIFENTLGENKSGGVYYTPPALSEFLTDETLAAHTFAMADRISASGHYRDTQDFIQKAPEAELILFYELLRSQRIADPACGSGQFLVQALHALSSYHQALSQRALTDSPALKAHVEKDYTLAGEVIYAIRRFITAHNIFGCDILPEAAEITRLRLFLAMVEGISGNAHIEPLPNIDFHIRTGNALTGFLQLPEDFFSALPKKKKQARPAEQHVLDFGGAPDKMLKKENLIFLYTNEKNTARALELRREIRALDQELAAVLDQRLEQLLGEWKVKAKNKVDFIDFKKDEEASGALKNFQLKARDLAPLHWGLEFSRVLHPSAPNPPGFDVILTNPPWEVWKPNSQEFFERHIADFRGLDKNAARKAVATCFKKEPALKREWLQHCALTSSMAEFWRSSDFFPARGSGDINLYKLFLERAFYLLKEGGSLGMVVPSGLYSDLGCKDLRRLCFEQSRLNFLYGFENAKALFENVHRSFKFILLSLSRSEIPGTAVPAAFMLHTESELRQAHAANKDPRKDPGRFLRLPLELIRRLSPEALSLMEFKSATDIAIVEKMARFPRLGEELPRTWNVKLSAEFHMTNDAHLFMTRAELEKKGAAYDAESMIWKKGKEEWWPLYEGKMIWQYEQIANGTLMYWVNCDRKSSGQKKGPLSLAFRKVGQNTNIRNMIVSALPEKGFTGNSLGLLSVSLDQSEFFLLTFLNSFIVDWELRKKIDKNLQNHFVEGLHIPRFPPAPSKKPGADEAAYRRYERALIEAAARLVGTTAAFDALLQEVFGGKASHKTHGVTDLMERQKLKNAIDGMVARIYGLTEEEFQHVLGSFPLVAEDVKAGVLEAFRELGE